MNKTANSCTAVYWQRYQKAARGKSDKALNRELGTSKYFTNPAAHQGWAERLYRRAHLIEAHKRGIKV